MFLIRIVSSWVTSTWIWMILHIGLIKALISHHLITFSPISEIITSPILILYLMITRSLHLLEKMRLLVYPLVYRESIQSGFLHLYVLIFYRLKHGIQKLSMTLIIT